jgi:methionine-S-sulfoxide reductase
MIKKVSFSFLILFIGVFMQANEKNDAQAYFAGGCFWGVEYYFQQQTGVISAISGYMGGNTPSPSYKEVSSGQTGHLEVVKVEYNPKQISYEALAKLFFEIHDFTQTNGQGPDIGSQYLSAVFYSNEEEKNSTKQLIAQLEQKGYKVATRLISTHNTPFFEAEEYHQDYYFKTGKMPYCHAYRKIF